MIDYLLLPALGIFGFIIGQSLRAGYLMAREWHADGADLDVLAQFHTPWASKPEPRLTFGWATHAGWKLYIAVARIRMKRNV